jgi:hypothetical protein
LSRPNWRSLAPLACSLSCMLTGCFHGGENHLAVTAAVGTGQVTAVQPVTQWRRKPLSLRLLGRLLDQPEQAQALPGAISPAVVTWAARGSYPNGVDDSTDLGALGEQLFGRISSAGLSPVDRVTSSR